MQSFRWHTYGRALQPMLYNIKKVVHIAGYGYLRVEGLLALGCYLTYCLTSCKV